MAEVKSCEFSLTQDERDLEVFALLHNWLDVKHDYNADDVFNWVGVGQYVDAGGL